MHEPLTIGVDIGGVVIGRQNDGSDTSFFGPDYLATTAVPYVFEALRQLVEEGNHVHLVSKCGPSVEDRTRRWLSHHHFFERTGVDPTSLHFCRLRPEKGPICARLGAHVFVDDRLDVLDCLHTVPHLFLFGPRTSDAARHRAGHRARLVHGWYEVLAHLATLVPEVVGRGGP